MNSKPTSIQINSSKTDFQRRFPRRQATFASLVQQNQKLLNLRKVFTIRNFSWFLTWIVCFAGAFLQSYTVILSFSRSETTTSIEYVPTSDLPAITICFDKSDLINTDNETIRRTINQLDISKQLNFTHSYAQLFTSCFVVTTQDYVPCEDILSITHFVTFDFKCISLHETNRETYQTKIKSKLLLNHTHIYSFALNKKLIGGRFDLTIHNLTNPLQILDQNWVKLSPIKYASAKVSFKHIQMSLLPYPYDTNCHDYKADQTKANCLNKCFIEEYYWKENYTWPPFVPAFNNKKKVLTNEIIIDNSTETEEGEKRSKRQIAMTSTLNSNQMMNTSSLLTNLNSPFNLKPASTASPNKAQTNVTKPKKLKSTNPAYLKILQNLNKNKQISNFLTKKLFIEKQKFKFKRDQEEPNNNFMSDKKYSIRDKPDVRGYCDYRCDRGQECYEDIYKPVRETEIEGSTEENAQSYIVEIQPSKYVFRCQTFEKYKKVHLACFIASTVTLWFGGSILWAMRYLISANLHSIRCLLFCNKKANQF